MHRLLGISSATKKWDVENRPIAHHMEGRNSYEKNYISKHPACFVWRTRRIWYYPIFPLFSFTFPSTAACLFCLCMFIDPFASLLLLLLHSNSEKITSRSSLFRWLLNILFFSCAHRELHGSTKCPCMCVEVFLVFWIQLRRSTPVFCLLDIGFPYAEMP